MNENVKIEVVTGQNKKDKTKTWKALKITIGEWSTLQFPNSDRPMLSSNFELTYIEKVLNGEA